MLYEPILAVDTAIAHVVALVNMIPHLDIYGAQTAVVRFSRRVREISSSF